MLWYPLGIRGKNIVKEFQQKENELQGVCLVQTPVLFGRCWRSGDVGGEEEAPEAQFEI